MLPYIQLRGNKTVYLNCVRTWNKGRNDPMFYLSKHEHLNDALNEAYWATPVYISYNEYINKYKPLCIELLTNKNPAKNILYIKDADEFIRYIANYNIRKKR